MLQNTRRPHFKTKLQLYLTAILPHLTCCQTVWHFCKQSERRKLERLQECAFRAIYICRTEKLVKTSLYNRRLREIVILMYKVRNSLAPDYIGELFNFANKGYSLINADFDIETLYQLPGPITLVQLFSSDRQRPSLDNFSWNIRKKDLTYFIEDKWTSCNLSMN